jgi:iron only hydrogenase large subunit-like protein
LLLVFASILQVCYAEKTQGVDVLSHLSSVRSPQAIMGALLKQHWAGAQQPPIPPESLYHVTVMPCYDKKLEGQL